jgi:hypothetical protein
VALSTHIILWLHVRKVLPINVHLLRASIGAAAGAQYDISIPWILCYAFLLFMNYANAMGVSKRRLTSTEGEVASC